MVRETCGNILAADVDALVCPVNTVGVMGAGLAKQFRLAYPAMFDEYVAACREHRLGIGHVIARLVGARPRFVVSFPTKRDWRQPSTLGWIDQGLLSLRETIDALEIRSIAVPALGCGLGGLRWPDVRGLIQKRLGDFSDVDVVLYAPPGEER